MEIAIRAFLKKKTSSIVHVISHPVAILLCIYVTLMQAIHRSRNVEIFHQETPLTMGQNATFAFIAQLQRGWKMNFESSSFECFFKRTWIDTCIVQVCFDACFHSKAQIGRFIKGKPFTTSCLLTKFSTFLSCFYLLKWNCVLVNSRHI